MEEPQHAQHVPRSTVRVLCQVHAHSCEPPPAPTLHMSIARMTIYHVHAHASCVLQCVLVPCPSVRTMPMPMPLCISIPSCHVHAMSCCAKRGKLLSTRKWARGIEAGSEVEVARAWCSSLARHASPPALSPLLVRAFVRRLRASASVAHDSRVATPPRRPLPRCANALRRLHLLLAKRRSSSHCVCARREYRRRHRASPWRREPECHRKVRPASAPRSCVG